MLAKEFQSWNTSLPLANYPKLIWAGMSKQSKGLVKGATFLQSKRKYGSESTHWSQSFVPFTSFWVRHRNKVSAEL